MAPIAVGDVIPDGTLAYLDDENKPQTASIHSLAAGKKVIILGFPVPSPLLAGPHLPFSLSNFQSLNLNHKR
ncbi:Peroxiredoxin-2B protein [Spatholobus suberectus]|nr:Peroxiredoxin-2B protein [Spatholobus suberectus]